nr:hypothetical protein [Paraburkholderia hiiakae]
MTILRRRDFTGQKMTTASGLPASQHERAPESLRTLSTYLELAVDEGVCVVLICQYADACAVYTGDPTGAADDLADHGTIAAALVDEIRGLAEEGANQMTIGDRAYRFIRSFTQIADRGAVVLTPL